MTNTTEAIRLAREYRSTMTTDVLRSWAADAAAALSALPRDAEPAFDMLAHLKRQAEFSAKTFGPGARVEGVTDHIAKELVEVRESGGDLAEWVDVIILAFDGAWRSGASPAQIIDAMVAKQTKNEGRKWPDWRTAPADKAIEHDRTGEVGAAPLLFNGLTPSETAATASVAGLAECNDSDSPWLICKTCAAAGKCKQAVPVPAPSDGAIYSAVSEVTSPDWHAGFRAGMSAGTACAQASTAAAAPEPVAGKWEGAEEWMPLAWALCADECGEEACTELVWEGGPVPEPWGDRWLKYEDEAKRLIALVREHVPATHPAPAVAATVQELPWPNERDVGRLEDMSPSGSLRVGLDNDNDVYVSVFNGEAMAGVEFCNGGGGGGRSPRTRMALIALMVAMEADNAERPDLDWWARRNGIATPAPKEPGHE